MKCRCGATAEYRCDCGEWLCGEDQCSKNCGGAVRDIYSIKSIEISTDMLFKLIREIREFRKTIKPVSKQDLLSKYRLKQIGDTLNSILHYHGLDGLFEYVNNVKRKNDNAEILFDALEENGKVEKWQ